MRRRLIALLGVLALTVAACGGGDDDTNASGDDTENTDGGSGEDLDAYCELAAEADALADDFPDEPSPDEFEAFLDDQRSILDDALEVVPEDIADELQTVSDGVDDVIAAAEDANFDLTDEALADEVVAVDEDTADASDAIDEFEADNCDTGNGGSSSGGDVEAYCALEAEADASEADLSDEPTPEEFEEFLNEQRDLLDQALEVVPEEIAGDLETVSDGVDAIITAAEDADFDVTDETFNEEAATIGDDIADASDALDEFQADNCEDGGGFSTSSTEPDDEPATTAPDPTPPDVDAYCAAATASDSLSLPEDPSPRQFKQFLLTQQDLIIEASLNVPDEIFDDYLVYATAFQDVGIAAEAAGYEISDPAVLDAIDVLVGDPDVLASTEVVIAFNAANCGDGGTTEGGDPLALCTADDTVNLIADELFSSSDPAVVETAFADLILVLEQAVIDAPPEIRPDVEFLLGAFQLFADEAALRGFDFTDPDLQAVVEAIFDDPLSIEASDNIDAWVAENCDTGEGATSGSLDDIVTLCSAGNLFACDVLYTTSDVGSEEENLSLACGGSSMAGLGGECFDESSFVAVGDSPEMDEVTDLCLGGDGQACYGLYINSAIGSEYETVGVTCGFLQDETDDPFNCVTGDIGAG
jgi:uncharacterized protein YjgD (DUF1641 family)